jgi:predicted secreted Zn-dependent protease
LNEIRRALVGRTAALLAGCALAIVLVGCGIVETPTPTSVAQAATASPVTTPSPTPSAFPTTSPAPVPPSPSAAPSPVSSPIVIPALRTPRGVKASVTYPTYLVTGTTALDLLRSMEQAGGPDVYNWSIDWHYRWPGGPAPCHLSAWGVTVRIELRVPRWTPPKEENTDLVARWRRFMDALRLHELGHAQDALDAGGKIAAYFRTHPSSRTCKGLQAKIETFGSKAVDATRAWDVHYDNVTNHGTTQGAFWS